MDQPTTSYQSTSDVEHKAADGAYAPVALYGDNPPAPPTHSGLATAGMILGITSLIFWWMGVGELAQVVLAVVFSSYGLDRAKKHGITNRGQAVAGMACGCVGAAFYVIWGIATLGAGFIV
jgi:hypothetical protein